MRPVATVAGVRAQLAGVFDVMPRRWGIDGARAMAMAGHQLVDDLGEVVTREAIDCHYAKGGLLIFATTPKQRDRVEKFARLTRKLGFGDADYRLLSADQTREHLRTARLYGSVYSPHGAAVHPARLARGLAEVAERNGVDVYEQTMVRSIDDGRVETSHGTVTADVVVRATEGYTRTITGNERAMLPLQTFVIATEPLPPEQWDEIGLARRETFEDTRLRLFYGQRTADDRIVLGGLGYPYKFNSGVELANGARIYQRLRAVLVELFPVLARTSITHEWGGVLGIPSNMTPGVGFDPAAKLAWGGGYLGAGVPASYLAGRTLADLICGRDTDLTRLPWVGGRSTRLGTRAPALARRARCRAGGRGRRQARPFLAFSLGRGSRRASTVRLVSTLRGLAEWRFFGVTSAPHRAGDRVVGARRAPRPAPRPVRDRHGRPRRRRRTGRRRSAGRSPPRGDLRRAAGPRTGPRRGLGQPRRPVTRRGSTTAARRLPRSGGLAHLEHRTWPTSWPARASSTSASPAPT